MHRIFLWKCRIFRKRRGTNSREMQPFIIGDVLSRLEMYIPHTRYRISRRRSSNLWERCGCISKIPDTWHCCFLSRPTLMKKRRQLFSSTSSSLCATLLFPSSYCNYLMTCLRSSEKSCSSFWWKVLWHFTMIITLHYQKLTSLGIFEYSSSNISIRSALFFFVRTS